MSYMLQMKGRLAELKVKKQNLAIACDAHMKAIKEMLAMSSITPLAEIDIRSVAFHARELEKKHSEYLRVIGDIETIRKELGEE